MQKCVVLLLLLIPLAVGSLWVAKHGSHGATNYCFIDPEGKHATFIYEGYFGNGADLRCRTFKLDSGKQVSREKHFQGIICMGDKFATRRFGGRFQFHEWDEVPYANEPITFSVPTFGSGTPQIQTFIHGLVVATEKKAESTRIVLVDPQSSQVVDEVELRGDVQFNPWRLTNFVQLIVGSGPNQISRLLRIEDKKIVLGADLTNLQYISPTDEAGLSYAFMKSADGKSMEVRSPKNNEVHITFELPQNVTNPGVSYLDSGSSWVSIGPQFRRVAPVRTVDIYTGSELPVPSDWLLFDRSRTSRIMLTTSLIASPDRPAAKLVDEVSGAVIADIASGRIIASRFIANGKQLTIATADQRIMRIDTRTGKVLKVIAPYWYIPYLEILAAAAYFCWCCLWLRCSPALQRHAWIDCAIITGLCVGYIVLRTRMTGFPGEVVRPIYQFAEGIFAAWMILSSLWLVLGRTRFSLRVLPQIGIAGLAILITLACVGFQNPRIWEFVIATILLNVWLVIVLVPLRFVGYKFVLVKQSEQQETTEKLARGAIPMRDLFLLTTVLAGMFALGRFVPPALQLTVIMVVDLFVLVLAISFTALAAVRVGLSRKSFGARLLTLLVAAVFGLLLPFLWTAIQQGWKAFSPPDNVFLFWELRLHASTAIATALCLYAFRHRGWRLTRSRLSVVTDNQ